MADDKDRTPPDLLGSLLAGKKQAPAPEQAGQPTSIPASQQDGIPEGQPDKTPAKKPARSRKKPAPRRQKPTPEPSGEKIKATFYLAEEAVDSLEEAWIQLRKMAPKDKRGQVSKSMIIELALQMAIEELESKGERSQIAKKLSKE